MDLGLLFKVPLQPEVLISLHHSYLPLHLILNMLTLFAVRHLGISLRYSCQTLVNFDYWRGRKIAIAAVGKLDLAGEVYDCRVFLFFVFRNI